MCRAAVCRLRAVEMQKLFTGPIGTKLARRGLGATNEVKLPLPILGTRRYPKAALFAAQSISFELPVSIKPVIAL
jgi:hypothetical protein